MPRPGPLIFPLTALLVIACASSSARATSTATEFNSPTTTLTLTSGNATSLGPNGFTGLAGSGLVPPALAPLESASFTVSGAAFSGFTEELISHAIFVNVQDVTRAAHKGGSHAGIMGGAPIPEPSTALLLGTAMVGLGAYARRKLKQRNRECR